MQTVQHKWWMVSVLAIAVAVVFIEQTAVSVALPQMQAQLHASEVMMQWMMNAYLLSVCVFLLLGGKLGDVLGQRRSLFLGIIVFTAGSLSCALSIHIYQLLFSRVLQGFGGGLIMPATAAIITKKIANEERGRAMGIYVSVATMFGASGPLIGGVLTQFFGWRGVFWINLPIGIAALILGFRYVPRIAPQGQWRDIDWYGFIVAAISITAIIIFIMEAVDLKWTSEIELNLLFLSILTIALFILIQRRQQNPILDLHIFFYRGFTPSNILMIVMRSMMMLIIFWSMYFQSVLGYSPLMTGVLLLPWVIPGLFMPPLSGYMRDNYGPRLPIIIGLIFVIVASAWVAYFAYLDSYAWLFPAMLAYGVGHALVMPNTVTTAMSSVQDTERGMAGGITAFTRQFGGVLGLAIFGAVIANVMEMHLGHTRTQDLVFDAVTKHAYTVAFSVAMIFAAVIAIAALFAAIRLPRKI
tara:strand:- start:8324 stop:9730 length:1407 start_codon:yes stop_codon:yes gene_type:complete